MSHRQGMITVVTIFAVCAVFAPSRTPERFAAWNRWAEYGLIAFQRYANPVPQRRDQAFGSF